MATRLTLVLAPLLMIGLAAGLSMFGSALHSRFRIVRSHWIAVLLLISPAALAVVGLIHPPADDSGMPAIVQALRNRRKPAEVVYIAHGSIPTWLYYSTDWRAPDSAHLRHVARFMRVEDASSWTVSPGPIQTVRGEAELLGLPTGERWGEPLFRVPQRTELRALSPRVLGWSDREAERIREAAHPRIWAVITAERRKPDGQLLLGACSRAGGRVLSRFQVQDVVLYEFLFDSENLDQPLRTVESHSSQPAKL